MLIVEQNAQEYMRSTIVKGEPILHIHSLRYYLYTIYMLWTLIHVNDVGFDIWLMSCKSPWNEALVLSTSITAIALVSNVSKLEALAGLILSGEDFSFFFMFLSLGAERWELIEGVLDCVLSRCSSNLTDICKSPISREYSHWEEAVCGLEMLAGCSLIVEACGCLGGGNVRLYIHGCIGHAWGMWMTDMAPRQGSHQRLLLKFTTVQVISK